MGEVCDGHGTLLTADDAAGAGLVATASLDGRPPGRGTVLASDVCSRCRGRARGSPRAGGPRTRAVTPRHTPAAGCRAQHCRAATAGRPWGLGVRTVTARRTR